MNMELPKEFLFPRRIDKNGIQQPFNVSAGRLGPGSCCTYNDSPLYNKVVMKRHSVKLFILWTILVVSPVLLQAVPVHIAVPALGEGMQRLKQWTSLVTFLELESDLDIELIITKDNKVIREGLESKNYDLAFIDPFWLSSWNKTLQLVPLVQAVVRGKSERSVMLVVHRDSIYRSLKDLKNRRVAFTLKNESAAGFYIPVALMTSMGINPFEYFKESVFAETFGSILKSVAYGKLDAGFITSNVYNDDKNRPLTGVLRVIASTDLLPQWVLVSRKDVDSAKIHALKNTLIRLSSLEEGRTLLKETGFSGFIPADAEQLSVMEKYNAPSK